MEQIATLTEAQLNLQKAQDASSVQALVTEELRKRLEVLEAERCHLATALSERQQEILSVSPPSMLILTLKVDVSASKMLALMDYFTVALYVFFACSCLCCLYFYSKHVSSNFYLHILAAKDGG